MEPVTLTPQQRKVITSLKKDVATMGLGRWDLYVEELYQEGTLLEVIGPSVWGDLDFDGMDEPNQERYANALLETT